MQWMIQNCLQLIQKKLSFKNIKPKALSAEGMMGIYINGVFDGPITHGVNLLDDKNVYIMYSSVLARHTFLISDHK